MEKFDKEDQKYINSGELTFTYEKEDLFELYENEYEDILVDETDDGYTLYQEDRGKQGFVYSVYNPLGIKLESWVSFSNILEYKNIKKSPVYHRFLVNIKLDKDEYNNAYDEDEFYPDDSIMNTPRKTSWFSKGYYPSKTIWATPKKTNFFDDLTKSDTLVFHREDPSTEMLSQIYKGKNWDIIRHTYDLDENELHRVVEAHDRLVFLGHGSGSGLIGMFGPEMAEHMKGKKIFAIWCNADAYFSKHGLGQGQFITKNAPSEVWECRAAGCGNISRELMLENITYWSKLCADVVEECLNGNPQKGVDYIRQNYLEQYGNHPVSLFNADSAHILGSDKPLPKYIFKGKHLEEKDYPIPYFDEEEFLKHPTPKASECPRQKDAPSTPEEVSSDYYGSNYHQYWDDDDD